MDWRQEIIDLHRFFQAYFLGSEDSLARVEEALDPAFSIVGPDGRESDRAATLDMLRAGHAHTDSLVINTVDRRLLHAGDDLLVTSYMEHHELRAGSNQRLTTAVFIVDPAGPNGVRWLRAHETWLEGDAG